jgi:hypothetical protein
MVMSQQNTMQMNLRYSTVYHSMGGNLNGGDDDDGRGPWAMAAMKIGSRGGGVTGS